MSEKTESRYMELLNALAFQPAEWKRPMDVGAWDASWHSGYLRRLVKRGDAERVTRGSSRSFEYRITTRGLARLVKDRVPLDEAVVPGAYRRRRPGRERGPGSAARQSSGGPEGVVAVGGVLGDVASGRGEGNSPDSRRGGRGHLLLTRPGGWLRQRPGGPSGGTLSPGGGMSATRVYFIFFCSVGFQRTGPQSARGDRGPGGTPLEEL